MTRGHSLRIACFGMSGPLSVGALEAIAAEHTVAAVIQPAPRGGSGGRIRRLLGRVARASGLVDQDPFDTFRSRYHFPLWQARSAADPEISARLDKLRPDLICLAGYPWLIPETILSKAPFGAINLHGALLPRHRGVLPLFWIYYHDDRETGVTVHRASAEADAGEILGQTCWPLERAFPVEQLNRTNGERGRELLATVLRDIAAGRTAGRLQDEGRATKARMVRPGTPMVDFATWDVERVWHFLAGLFPRFREPLNAPDGTPVRYGSVKGHRRESHPHLPGTVVLVAGGYDLFCRGGRVHLGAGD